MYINRFEDLIVWQKAHDFVKRIYKDSEFNFPDEEKYGIESQLKRAVVSVPANIAEGSRRHHTKELIQFLNIAQSSLSEVRYYLYLSKDLGYITENKYKVLLDDCLEIDKMLNSLIYKLKNKP
ncbi:MAG: four helix bundle protein [Clostridia bacterium]|nr:four helix bundle protein [Clostridia bacterium]